MNKKNERPIESLMADVQNQSEKRRIYINSVGVRGVLVPLSIQDKNGLKNTVGRVAMYVGLPEDVKGTHMSRLIDIINSNVFEISVENFDEIIIEVISRLEARSGYVEFDFPYFMEKLAPVSKVKSLMDYEVALISEVDTNGVFHKRLRAKVPVTSLCPCSKMISRQGAHNQRSSITITVDMVSNIWIEDLIRVAEEESSCELWGMLKRTDEKYVTEKAYNNPKFVEDIVRDVACALNRDKRIGGYTVEVENFESIHNHSAYASISN